MTGTCVSPVGNRLVSWWVAVVFVFAVYTCSLRIESIFFNLLSALVNTAKEVLALELT